MRVIQLVICCCVFYIAQSAHAESMVVINAQLIHDNVVREIIVQSGALEPNQDIIARYVAGYSPNSGNFSGGSVCLVGGYGLKIGADYLVLAKVLKPGAQHKPERVCAETLDIGSPVPRAFQVVRVKGQLFVKFDDIRIIYPSIKQTITYWLNPSAERGGQMALGSLVPYGVFLEFLDRHDHAANSAERNR